MVNYIWAGLMLVSIVFGILTGRAQEVSDALFSGAMKTAELGLFLFGTMVFFSGLMRIGHKSGITRAISKIFSPLLKLLFPGINPDSPAAQAITLNMSANFLGLGNAATPFGLQAMNELNKENKSKGAATSHMITFVVINTASIQLIPTAMASLRAKYGAVSPMDIMPAVWLSSISALAVGLLAVFLLGYKHRRSEKRSGYNTPL